MTIKAASINSNGQAHREKRDLNFIAYQREHLRSEIVWNGVVVGVMRLVPIPEPQITLITGFHRFLLYKWMLYFFFLRMTTYKYRDITEKIIGCCMRVHRELGTGFQEVIYQRALAIEFFESGLRFIREQEMTILYKQRDIGTRRMDFLIEDHIMLEIKAVSALDDVHKAQALNYLEAYGLEIGLLINFGSKSLEFKRLIHTL